SDLAYRLWRDGERASGTPGLIAYRVIDSSGQLRSSFSLIPESRRDSASSVGHVVVDRYDLALVRRSASLAESGKAWGRVDVAVADWPAWDPLPPRIDVYRRLVSGGASAAAHPPAPRPLVASYAPDGEKRDEGPTLPARILDRLRRGAPTAPAPLRFRGQQLRGEGRKRPAGFLLVAVPGPDLLGRLLRAALLLPALALLAAALGAIVLWRLLATPREARHEILPPGVRTFRGRLVAFFVLGVMIPLLAVTLYLHS